MLLHACSGLIYRRCARFLPPSKRQVEYHTESHHNMLSYDQVPPNNPQSGLRVWRCWNYKHKREVEKVIFTDTVLWYTNYCILCSSLCFSLFLFTFQSSWPTASVHVWLQYCQAAIYGNSPSQFFSCETSWGCQVNHKRKRKGNLFTSWVQYVSPQLPATVTFNPTV